MTALAASKPLFGFDELLFFELLLIAWDMFKDVIIPFPIGFWWSIINFMIASKVDLQINSKWGVSPLITHPKAKNPLNLFMFFFIMIGISKTPGTLMIFSLTLFFINVLFGANNQIIRNIFIIICIYN